MIWLLVLLGILGAVLVASGDRMLTWHGHVCWIGVNTGLVWHNWSIGETAQAVLFGVYLAIALIGVWRWRW